MARPDVLIAGNCYFHLNYYDKDLLLPAISTLTYLRCVNDDDGQRIWLFQEPPADDPEASGEEDGREHPVGFHDDQLYQILEFPELLTTLKETAADHPLKAPLRVASTPVDVRADFSDLPDQVARFLHAPELVSLTITIRFTDDALSLGRRNDGAGWEMGFFLRPRRETAKEISLLALFERFGIRPHVDYLADAGRTRVLEFGIPDDVTAIVELCKRVLTEIHQMRTDDALDYAFLSRSDIKRS